MQLWHHAFPPLSINMTIMTIYSHRAATKYQAPWNLLCSYICSLHFTAILWINGYFLLYPLGEMEAQLFWNLPSMTPEMADLTSMTPEMADRCSIPITNWGRLKGSGWNPIKKASGPIPSGRQRPISLVVGIEKGNSAWRPILTLGPSLPAEREAAVRDKGAWGSDPHRASPP